MLVTFVFIFALAFYFDPWTPLLMFGAVLVVQLLFSLCFFVLVFVVCFDDLTNDVHHELDAAVEIVT